MKDRFGTLSQNCTHVSIAFLTVVIVPSFHAFVFFLTLERVTASTSAYQSRRY